MWCTEIGTVLKELRGWREVTVCSPWLNLALARQLCMWLSFSPTIQMGLAGLHGVRDHQHAHLEEVREAPDVQRVRPAPLPQRAQRTVQLHGARHHPASRAAHRCHLPQANVMPKASLTWGGCWV